MFRCPFNGALLALLFSLPSLFGCSSQPFEHVPVSGSVKYDDGTLLEADLIQVIFEPIADPKDEKTYPQGGMAEVNVVDGTFSQARTHKYDGIVAGKHKVLIRAFGGEYGEQLSIIPAEYGDRATTPEEIDTANGTEFHFKIPKSN